MRSLITMNRIVLLLMLATVGWVLAAPTALLGQPANCPPGMTHYWKLDETAGGPYDDYYGTNDATCTNCPAGVAGEVSGAQDFDGSNDRIDVPDDGTFDWSATASFTIEFWMKSAGCVCTQAGFDCNQVIVGRATAVNAWWIGLNCQTNGNVGKLRCYLGASADFYSTAYVDDDQWHHIVYQFDQPAGQYRLYIDGVLDNSISAAGLDRSGSGPLQVGYYSTNYQYYGILDELALYNAVLGEDEISGHFAGGSSGIGYCDVSAAPTIISTPVTAATVAEAYSYDVNAAGVPAPTFALLTAPSGMTIDANSGVISWLPTTTGNFAVEVQAVNSEGSDTQPFTIAVAPVRVCTPELTHYWMLDETVASLYDDYQGGHDAHCGNCPTPVAGQVGGAQALDRVDDGLNVFDDGSFDWGATQSFTIEFWMNETAVCDGTTQPDNEVIVGRSGAGWWIGVNCESPLPTQKIRAYLQGTQLFSTTVVNDGGWHHVVFVHDASAGSYTLYVDSVAEASLATAGNNLVGADSLTIGYFNGPDVGRYRYGGTIDELAFYNAALPEQTIRTHYNHGFGGRYCYVCGDADASGATTISDVVYLINFIFAGGEPPAPLLAGDADCNGFITISDAVYLVNFIFSGGPAPCANCP
ncbi:MAG: putative Ig domain-containing protein [candidate division Zixibacteria bacterium]|nr:putative Ig domain-containing protein [candidate division Zixibacteria bacterium]